jgi:hypothetical protein
MKATVAQAKRLGAGRDGLAGFKHRLMDYLEIPRDQFDKWDVPIEWINAFLKVNNRPPIKPRHQATIAKATGETA